MIGFCCSCFDLLHAGHVLMLEAARSQCDELWVGLQSSPSSPEKSKPVQSLYERWVQLAAVRWVDKIIPYDTEDDLYRLLVTLPPHTRFLGDDYFKKSITGSDLYGELIDTGNRIVYLPRDHGWSTTTLRRRVTNASKEEIKTGRD